MRNDPVNEDYEDPLATARGVLNGLAFALTFWLSLALLIAAFIWWR